MLIDILRARRRRKVSHLGERKRVERTNSVLVWYIVRLSGRLDSDMSTIKRKGHSRGHQPTMTGRSRSDSGGAQNVDGLSLWPMTSTKGRVEILEQGTNEQT